MIVKAKKLNKRTERLVRDRIERCGKRGGESASLFLDTEMNESMLRAKSLFFAGGKKKWSGMISVFYPNTKEAEFTVAVAEGKEKKLPALFRSAKRECYRNGVEELYMVTDPKRKFRYMDACGTKFEFSHSEFFLVLKTEGRRLRENESSGDGVPEGASERENSGKGSVEKTKTEETSLRYCLKKDSEEAAECFVSAFDAEGCWYLHHLETKESLRRRGYAERLVKAVIRDATEQKAGFIRLQVSSGNAAALGLYRKLGFETEEQRDYYRIME